MFCRQMLERGVSFRRLEIGTKRTTAYNLSVVDGEYKRAASEILQSRSSGRSSASEQQARRNFWVLRAVLPSPGHSNWYCFAPIAANVSPMSTLNDSLWNHEIGSHFLRVAPSSVYQTSGDNFKCGIWKHFWKYSCWHTTWQSG